MCLLRLLWMGDIFVFFCGSCETLNGNITPSYTNSSITACRSDTHYRRSWCILAEDGADRRETNPFFFFFPHKPFQHCPGTVNLQSIWQSSVSGFHSFSDCFPPWPLDQKLEFWFYRTREFCFSLWEFFRSNVENLNGFQTGFLKASLPGLVRCCFLNFILSFFVVPLCYSYLCPNNRVKKKTPGNNYFLAARTTLKPKQCVCVYLLQGGESRVAVSEVKTSVGEAESGQVPQSQILRQWKTLGQTRLLTLIHQLLHLCVQT